MTQLTGLAVSPGLAMGQVALWLQQPFVLRYTITESQIARECDRLDRALAQSRHQLGDIRTRVTRTAGPELAQIFEAQLLMLEDRLLVLRARELVERDRVNAEWALQDAFDEVCELFSGIGDDYLRDRRGDVADVVGRVRRNLQTGTGGRRDVLTDLEEGSVLVADDLSPSIAAQLDRRRVVGLVIETGSRTHHSAILARSLGIPAVAGVANVTRLVRPGDTVLVDGTSGLIRVNPDIGVFESALARQRATAAVVRPDLAREPAPVLTTDGVAVRIEANIERPSEAAAAKRAGFQGIGLFRTEYLIGGQAVEALDEERQYTTYRELLETLSPLPVAIRTFDLDEAQSSGRDRGGRDDAQPVSSGPLGMRAIRLSLSRRDVFATQLRALVRAARHGHLRVIFPFVTTVDELREARAVLRATQHEISARDGQDPAILVGAMIEVPSAALTADLLADEVDFFSIGTNDLVQDRLAVDRTDSRMAALYEPLHPAILRVIRLVVRAARARKRPVSVCGEMAADPLSLAMLVGLGVTELSMAPASMPMARRIITAISRQDMGQVARKALRLHTGRDVTALVADALKRAGQGNGPGSEGGANGE